MKKKIALVLGLIFTIVIAGMIACNSATKPSKKKEGITEITGPANQDSLVKSGSHPVTTMGWDATDKR